MIAAFVGLCVLSFIVLFILYIIVVYEALFGEVED